ncbi:MAG: hypothetical protein K2J40_08340 [Ruminococcus sp.]|nr:hypothetical protein [Ruminococcus sp.]
MITEEIRAAIGKRASGAWEHLIKQCWEEETEILSRNIDDTIDFLENECTADEFSWLSEVFDDVAERTQSRKFVDCLYRVADKYPEESAKYHIVENLKYAEDALHTD